MSVLQICRIFRDRITKVTLEDEIAKISHKNVAFTKIDLTELIGKEEETENLSLNLTRTLHY